MNKVISDYHINTCLLDLIKGSKKYLILISPYVKPWGHLIDELTSSRKRGVDVELYYRSDKKDEYVYSLEPLKEIGVKMFHIDTLHSKLYLSESMGIMSSMNLVDFSSSNSKEMGLVTDDENILKQFKDYSKELISKSSISKKSLIDRGMDFYQDVRESIEEVKDVIQDFKDEGNCIRCCDPIPFDMKKPYCGKCFKSWNKYKNENFKEKNCHKCRVERETTFINCLAMNADTIPEKQNYAGCLSAKY